MQLPCALAIAPGLLMSRRIWIGNSQINIGQSTDRSHAAWSALICGAVALACFASTAKADEGGVSFWLPGLFGSLAAVPQQPGWSLATVYYHTTVSAGADVARAREITIGKIPVNQSANLSATLEYARADLALVTPRSNSHDSHSAVRPSRGGC